MRKRFAISCAFLLLATLVILTGCGSGSDQNAAAKPTASALLISSGDNRAISISWTPMKSPGSNYRLVEYHVFRHATDSSAVPMIVGVTTPSVTNFTDTATDHSFSYNTSSGGSQNSYVVQQMANAPGLTMGNYTYSVEAFYSSPDPSQGEITGLPTAIGHSFPVAESAPIGY